MKRDGRKRIGGEMRYKRKKGECESRAIVETKGDKRRKEKGEPMKGKGR